MASKRSPETVVESIEKGQFEATLLGTMPLILNRMSQKAQREILLPSGRKSAADKAAKLKHNPHEEFRASPYTDSGDGPTFLRFPASGIKKAMAWAALDLSGPSKAQTSRLCWAEGEWVPIWGVPKLFMSIVRSADMNKTPDVRTRCIVPQWATRVVISHALPILKRTVVVNLLAAAGIITGIGDWRSQKGAGTYGSFEIVDSDDPRVKHIMAAGGREAQLVAMKQPEPYDDETAEMLTWFSEEATRRGFAVGG